MVGSNCQLQHSRPIFLGSSRPCHSPSVPFNMIQGRPHPCYMKLDHVDTSDHRTPLASDMKSDWSSLQHKYSEWMHWHRFLSPPPKKKKKKKKPSESQMHTDWWWVLTDKLGPLSVVLCQCELNQTIGSECNARLALTTQDVVTGSHQLLKFDTVVATFTDYHWWLNKPCKSNATKTKFHNGI